MKLLIATQAIDKNNAPLGFFLGWVREFAKHCEQVTVICLYEGEYDLPANVKVLSLGKERKIQDFGASKVRRAKNQIDYALRFYMYIWRERENYEAVFVHMNQVYVILGGLIWKAWRKRIGFWYTHRAVNFSLRLAERIVDQVFTASKEGFRVRSEKVSYLGHGIDVLLFSPEKEKRSQAEFSILYVGRITGIKNQDLLIEAANILYNKQGLRNLRIRLAGSVSSESDKRYLAGLKEIILEYRLDGVVNFLGKVENTRLPSVYNESNLTINLSPTGGMDKTVLESLACGVPVLARNQEFREVLGGVGLLLPEAVTAENLAEKIAALMDEASGKNNGAKYDRLYENVRTNFSQEKVVLNILEKLSPESF